MANRRMFSTKVIDTDAFLDMPVSTQALYFHLAMRADDDGFVSNPRKIARMLGTTEDDYKVLIGKRFVIPFESGICVIKHWRVHNYIQNDRYTQTQYIEEKSRLTLKENGAYTEAGGAVSTLDTQDRLEIGKDRKEQDKQTYGEFQNVRLTTEEAQKLKDRYGTGAARRLVEELSTYLKSSGKRYQDHYATLLNWAKRKGIEEAKRLPPPPPPVKLTPEELAKTEELKKGIRSIVKRLPQT